MHEEVIRAAQESAYSHQKAYADKAYAGKAMLGQSLGNAPQQPLSSKISSALDMAKATLDQLSSLADRTLGSYPTPVSDQNRREIYTSTMQAVDDLTDTLHQIASVSARLSSGL